MINVPFTPEEVQALVDAAVDIPELSKVARTARDATALAALASSPTRSLTAGFVPVGVPDDWTVLEVDYVVPEVIVDVSQATLGSWFFAVAPTVDFEAAVRAAARDWMAEGDDEFDYPLNWGDVISDIPDEHLEAHGLLLLRSPAQRSLNVDHDEILVDYGSSEFAVTG